MSANSKLNKYTLRMLDLNFNSLQTIISYLLQKSKKSKCSCYIQTHNYITQWQVILTFVLEFLLSNFLSFFKLKEYDSGSIKTQSPTCISLPSQIADLKKVISSSSSKISNSTHLSFKKVKWRFPLEIKSYKEY